jgi:hypothetical protein
MCAAVSDSSSDFDAMMKTAGRGAVVAEPSSDAAPSAGEARAYVLPDGQRVVVTTEGYQVRERRVWT